MSKKTRINLPTILTLLRIILVVPLLVCIFMDSVPARIVAVACFVLASITDFVDGRLARGRNEVTNLGKFLDPLADKMLVNLTFLALVVLGQVPVWVFGIILVRDFAVDGVRMMAASKRVVIDASKYGKAKTMVQMITISFIILNLIVGSEVLNVINMSLLGLVVCLTVGSGLDYIVRGWKHVI